MSKALLFFFVVFLLPFVQAHDYQSTGEKTVELEILPSEPPKEGRTSILSFRTTNNDGSAVTHIDGFATIQNKDGEVLLSERQMHSHASQFSTTVAFPEAGEYMLVLRVQSSDDYEGEKFEPITVTFLVSVEPVDGEGTSTFLYGLGIFIALGILVPLVLRLKNSKKKEYKEDYYQ